MPYPFQIQKYPHMDATHRTTSRGHWQPHIRLYGDMRPIRSCGALPQRHDVAENPPPT